MIDRLGRLAAPAGAPAANELAIAVRARLDHPPHRD
jgi:hypothetical protein